MSGSDDTRAAIIALATDSYNQGRIDALLTLKEGMQSVLDKVDLPDEVVQGINVAISCANASITGYEAEKK